MLAKRAENTKIRYPFFYNRFTISWISPYNHYQIRLDNTKCALRIGWCLSFSTIQNTHCVNDAIRPVSNTIRATMRAVSSGCPAGFLCSPSFPAHLPSTHYPKTDIKPPPSVAGVWRFQKILFSRIYFLAFRRVSTIESVQASSLAPNNQPIVTPPIFKSLIHIPHIAGGQVSQELADFFGNRRQVSRAFFRC